MRTFKSSTFLFLGLKATFLVLLSVLFPSFACGGLTNRTPFRAGQFEQGCFNPPRGFIEKGFGDGIKELRWGEEERLLCAPNGLPFGRNKLCDLGHRGLPIPGGALFGGDMGAIGDRVPFELRALAGELDLLCGDLVNGER